MKKFFITVIAVFLCIAGVSANYADGKIKINIVLKAQTDAMELSRMASAFPTKAERRDFVVNSLKNQTKETQSDLLGFLDLMAADGKVDDIRPLWIVNSIICYAEEWLIDELVQRDDVLAAYQCEEFQGVEGESLMSAERGDGREIAENIVKVNADKVWNLGYTGEDVLVAVIDTGVRLDHADLQGRLWDGGAEYPNHWRGSWSYANGAEGVPWRG